MTIAHTMKKKLAMLAAGVLALALVFGFMGQPVQAATADAPMAATAASGITYSANKKKVTLKNYNGGDLYFDKDVTIKLVGTNTIKTDMVSAPIINGRGTITFTGTGTLNIYSSNTNKTARGYGIQAKDGVIFKSGTVNLYGTGCGMRFGVQAPQITVHEGARLSIQAFGARDNYVAPYALFAIGKVTLVGSPAIYEGKTAKTAQRVGALSYELCTDSHIGGQYGTPAYVSIGGAPNPMAQPTTAVQMSMKNKLLGLPGWQPKPEGYGYEWIIDSVQLQVLTGKGKAHKGLLLWSSSNENVAKVDKDGVVRGYTLGSATITAKTLGGKKAKCTITVVEDAVSVEQVTVEAKSIVLARKGKTAKINCTVYPENASNKAVEYTSSNPKVVKVSKTGKLTALKKGSATITVRSKESGKTATVKVKVKK